jgi:hypothetical protein
VLTADTTVTATFTRLEPVVQLTYVPPLNSLANLQGRVLNLAAAEYATHRIIVHIRVAGRWWVKPLADQRLTPIGAGGWFVVDITTGGVDPTADLIRADLVPTGCAGSIPVVLNAPSLPAELSACSISHAEAAR